MTILDMRSVCDYTDFFVLATGIQFVAGYAGNRVLVFKRAAS